MSHHDIADQNVERLLVAAYRPEPIDPAFVVETEEKLLKAAQTESSSRASLLKMEPDARLSRIRRRLSWVMIAAAVSAAFLLGWYVSLPPTNRSVADIEKQIADSEKNILRVTGVKLSAAGLTAKPRPDAAKPPALE